MGKYLDPKADLTFKKIFGEHKHLVISLLNAMLPLKDDERVESIEYWPTEKIPKAEADAKLKQKDIDVACKLKAMGLSCGQIAEATGLTFVQIESL